MLVIDSGLLFLLALVAAGTGLGLTWMFIQHEKRDGDDEQ